MLTLTSPSVLSQMLDFYRGCWRLCLVNYTKRPIDLKYFFISFSHSILDVSIILPQWIVIVYAFLMSDQTYVCKCLYKWTFSSVVVNKKKTDRLFDIGITSTWIVLFVWFFFNLVTWISRLTSPKIDLFVCLSKYIDQINHVKHNLGTFL